MKNFIQDGKVLDWRNQSGTDAISGDTIKIGAVLGVACHDIPAGAVGSLRVAGSFDLPKATGESWKMGDALSWDASAGALTKVGNLAPNAGDLERCAFAVRPAEASARVGVAAIRNPGTPV